MSIDDVTLNVRDYDPSKAFHEQSPRPLEAAFVHDPDGNNVEAGHAPR